MFIAHTKTENDELIEQPLSTHLRNTAEYASECMKDIGLTRTSYCAGLIHDMGKYTSIFQNYIHENAKGSSNIKRGDVIHTFQGVTWLWENYHTKADTTIRKNACEAIACTVGAHHGLFDIISPIKSHDRDGIYHRVDICLKNMSNAPEVNYEECIRNCFADNLVKEEFDDLIEDASLEIEAFMNCIKEHVDRRDMEFCYGLMIRLLTSALINGDRQDTCNFMSQQILPKISIDRDLWKQQLVYMESKLDKLSNITIHNDKVNKVNEARKIISDKCLDFARRETGIFRLSVPTGSGKTLASLRYSLAHAALYKKKRIFFISPFLTVLDQNAQVIRNYISDQSLILEHHSDVAIINDGENSSTYESLISDWNTPIVITTMVQLLNTMFSGKTTAVRRFQALVKSVVVIDEVQSIPSKMISMFNCTVNFLSYCCDTTIVLCSATQPELGKTNHRILYSDDAEIVPYNDVLWKAFKRTEVINKQKDGGYSFDELVDFSHSVMNSVNSLLLVCNKKNEALLLYQGLNQIKECSKIPYKVYHLSTNMCKQHRFDVMDQIKRSLEIGERAVVVATQLIEAGVDLSFASVIRISAGLDSIAQAAGRCNRSNEYEDLCKVYVVNLKDEDLRHLNSIKTAQTALRDFWYFYDRSCKEEDDFLSPKAITLYYELLFEKLQNSFDYSISNQDLDEGSTTLFELLSSNKIAVDNTDKLEKRVFMQAFATAGKCFQVFDDEQSEVIVPYKGAIKLFNELCSERAMKDYSYLKEKLKEAEKYSVTLFSYQESKLMSEGKIIQPESKFYKQLVAENYDLNTGFIEDGNTIF